MNSLLNSYSVEFKKRERAKRKKYPEEVKSKWEEFKQYEWRGRDRDGRIICVGNARIRFNRSLT